jgi:cold shock CspA family protein
MSSDSISTTERKIGNVKWFNNKAGFGFITMGENTETPQDVFAHYSNINVKNSQYKYLVQGEYVEFDLSPTTESDHEFQATNITGILGGATLCERRRISREAAEASQEGEVIVRERKPRSSGEGAPRVTQRKPTGTVRRERSVEDASENDDGFRTVRKKRTTITPTTPRVSR